MKNMYYKIRFYYILNDDNTFHSSNVTQLTKYKYLCLHSSLTHKPTQKHHINTNYLMTDDLDKVTPDVIEKFIALCEERYNKNDFDVDYHEIRRPVA